MKVSGMICLRNVLLQFATLGVATAAAAATPAQALKFEEVFSASGEPAALHYAVEIATPAGAHHLDVWRDGERRVRRSTDGNVDIYAQREADDGEFRLSVLDRKRHIHNIIDRSNLYRIGNFTDWFDLGHGLRHPVGGYSLTAAAAPLQDKALESCRWYVLTTQQTTHVCWSETARIPLLIVAQDNKVLWRVTQLDRKALSADTFVIHDEGYIRNDTNQDIEND